ncbi:MAG: FHA domain-containing protein [Anaerolineae bacterium]
MSEIIARLVVQRGPEPGASFALTQDVVRIGRTATNDIAINDPEVSRQHAQLVRQPDGYTIQDLGSTNGTFVNYRRVAGLTLLSHGDVISFGEAIVLAYWDESATDSQPVPPPPVREQRPAAPPPRTSPPPASPQRPTPSAPPVVEAAPQAPPLTAEEYAAQRRRRIIIGCGVGALLLICLCIGALFFLDGYQQGRLLYCGGLRPFWELILGPFGFNPACP